MASDSARPAKPPWAGGWKAVGSAHPGWTQEKWDKWQQKQAAKGDKFGAAGRRLLAARPLQGARAEGLGARRPTRTAADPPARRRLSLTASGPAPGGRSGAGPMTLVDDYLARTPRSRELFERATGSLPGGSTRTTVYRAPYPPYVDHGAGLAITDVDGNVYRDFLGNYTSLILGHAHPAVVAAVEAQVRRGSAFAAPTETEVELAEEIRRRVPSIERLRFTSSGTEATMFAIRAARAFTGRPLDRQVRAARTTARMTA